MQTSFERPSTATIDLDSVVEDCLPTIRGDQISYQLARNRGDREAAFRLVYRAYLHHGMIAPNPCQMRVTPYHVLPTTEIFIAKMNSEVIGTLSLVGDGELGLPMECVYGEEIERLRRAGRRIGEVSCLADRRQDFVRTLPVIVQLTRLMAQYARHHDIDVLAITVHPKHARFYRRFMGFEQIGDERAYPSVCGKPGVPCCLDFNRIDRDRPACYDQYFAQMISVDELRPRPMSAAELDYFGPMVVYANGFTTLIQG